MSIGGVINKCNQVFSVHVESVVVAVDVVIHHTGSSVVLVFLLIRPSSSFLLFYFSLSLFLFLFLSLSVPSSLLLLPQSKRRTLD